MAQILIRMETKDGMKGYALDGEASADLAIENYKTFMQFCPGPIRTIIEGALFTLRKGGILKRMLRDKGLPEMCKGCPEPDLEAVRAIVRLVFKGMTDDQLKDMPAGSPMPVVDIRQRDMVEASMNVLQRREDLDGPALLQEPQGDVAPEIVEAIANEVTPDWYESENARLVESIAAGASPSV